MQPQMDLIHERAWSFARTTGLEFDELVGDAGLFASVALDKYDPLKKVKLSTFMWMCITNGLSTKVSREFKYREPLTQTEPISTNYDPARAVEFADSIAHLSEDAQEITRLLFSPGLPQKLGIPTDTPPKKIRGAIRNHLLTKKGWSWARYRAATKEIKGIL